MSSIAVMAVDPVWAHLVGRETISLFLIDQIKNIRFTNQSPQCNIFMLPGNRVGNSGGSGQRQKRTWRRNPRTESETEMSANYPVLPVAGGALVRAFASLLALFTHWFRELARARRHRREANVLAGLDRRMLADIGISRADVRDAFSEPFWDDPTALLRERALERRMSTAIRRVKNSAGVEQAFRRPATDRSARHTV
jgi:uncharacterized protein YjiS (DUF1127 family)